MTFGIPNNDLRAILSEQPHSSNYKALPYSSYAERKKLSIRDNIEQVQTKILKKRQINSFFKITKTPSFVVNSSSTSKKKNDFIATSPSKKQTAPDSPFSPSKSLDKLIKSPTSLQGKVGHVCLRHLPKKLTSPMKDIEKFPYNNDHPLSAKIIEFRKANDITPGRNVAIALAWHENRWIYTIAATTGAPSVLHAEIRAFDMLPSVVKDNPLKHRVKIATELHPCNRCTSIFKQLFPDVSFAYSFPFSNNLAERRKAASRFAEIQAGFGIPTAIKRSTETPATTPKFVDMTPLNWDEDEQPQVEGVSLKRQFDEHNYDIEDDENVQDSGLDDESCDIQPRVLFPDLPNTTSPSKKMRLMEPITMRSIKTLPEKPQSLD